jgi:hypothetical protein
MSKIYKATVYITDLNDDTDTIHEELGEFIKHRLGTAGSLVDVFEEAKSEEFEWHDELKINNVSATKADFDEYFKKER